jgi:TrmH family RNA methyltransferase
LHERALRAGVWLDSVLVAEARARRGGERAQALLDELRSCAGTVVHVVSESTLLELTEGREDTFVGLARLPAAPILERLLTDSGYGPPLLLVAVDVDDPGNVGALARTALASGAVALIGVGITDAWHPRAIRTSMGSVFKLPLPLYDSPATLLAELGALGVRSLGAATSTGRPLPEVVFDKSPVAFWLGSEAFGLSTGLVQELDGVVSVPMVPEVDSYSVNAAAAILLYEFRRQTGWPDGRA